MKKQTIHPIITHLLRAAFFLVLLGLAIYELPRMHAQQLSKEALKAAAATQAVARADVPLPEGQTPEPAVPTVCTLDGTLGTAPAGGATGNFSPRLFRGGVLTTTCTSATYPGTSGTGPYIYNVHYITNPTGAAICPMITLHYVSGGTATVNIQVGAFQAPFAPADISNAARYLGDPGTSSGAPPTVVDTTFPVNVPAGATIALVVWNVNVSPAGQAAVYQINLDQDVFCGPPAPIIAAAGSMLTAEGCAPPNMVVDPGETVTVNLKLMNNGALATTNLVATLAASGGVTNPSGPQNYGVIAPGGMATGSFTFTADSMLACGATITATLQLSDNGNPLPSVTFSFPTGANRPVVFMENFDGVTAPALPAGWLNTQTSGTGINWTTTTTTPDSAPNAAFANDPAAVNAAALSTPGIMITSASSQLSFRNKYITESTFDGCVLEYSTDGGTTWTDIITGGGTFVTGGYNATISTSFGNPIAGRMAWSGTSAGGYINTVVNLPAALNGQTVNFRWLIGSDSSVASTGQWVDDVKVLGALVCCVNTTPPVPMSAVSRKTHGGAGNFDVALPLVPIGGAVGIEPRNGPTHTMVVDFAPAAAVTVGGASVTTGTGAVGSFGVVGAVVTVNLTGVADVQRLGVTLMNVNDGMGHAGDVVIPMGLLNGDVSGIGNGSVNSTDVSSTKAAVSAGTVSGATFRADVNFSGTLTSTDIGVVKTKVPNMLPP